MQDIMRKVRDPKVSVRMQSLQKQKLVNVPETKLTSSLSPTHETTQILERTGGTSVEMSSLLIADDCPLAFVISNWDGSIITTNC